LAAGALPEISDQLGELPTLSVAGEVLVGAHVGDGDSWRTSVVADFHVKGALLVVVQECAADGEAAQQAAESTSARDWIARIVDVEPPIHAGWRELLLGHLIDRWCRCCHAGLAEQTPEPTPRRIADGLQRMSR
jgi:hypothetical protein